MDDAAEEKVLKRSENLKVLRLRMLYEQKEITSEIPYMVNF